MKKYLIINENGYPEFPVYFEGDKNIPKEAEEISDEEETNFLSNKYRDPETKEFKDIPLYEPTLDEIKSKKMKEVDAWTEAKITGGFTSSATGETVTYDSDKETQLTMQGIALSAGTDLFAEKYRDGVAVRGYAEGSSTKQVYNLTAAQVQVWCADLSKHINDCKQAGWSKQAAVQSAESQEDLDSVILT